MIDKIHPDLLEFVIRIGIATLAGLLIGLEREYKGKSAGLKTNALVSLGASIFVLISTEFQGQPYTDITRVLSQVVTGIGFLGAGVILHQEQKIKGLTTAATIWCSAALGCLAAFGMYAHVAAATVLVLFVNVIFGILDVKMGKREN